MPINNINTLQNYKDLKYTTDLANQDNAGVLNTDYYIHALANLEQRNEYRYSNGIKYGILTYDADEVVEYTDWRDKSLRNNTTLLELSNDMSFDITVNNIETYLKYSQIFNDGSNLRSLLFGKILGTDDTPESNNVEIQYTDIDLKNHIINEAYRVFYLDDSTNNNIYILIHLNKEKTTSNEHKYKLSVYKLILPTTDLEVKTLFRASTYASNNYPFKNIELNVNNTELFEQLIQYTADGGYSVYSDETIENNYTLNCTYDTIDEQLIKISDESYMSDSYNKINELLYFNYYNISQYIRAINNDLTVTYPNILKYYSNRQFNSNNETLKRMIAQSLFNYIINNLKSGEINEDMRLVVPKGTTITYVSNVENALQIYYTDDIYVYFINNRGNNLTTNAGIKGIKFEYGGNDKTIIYNIYSKYNTKYSDLVDCFIVYKKYVLPYIDDSHLWNINDYQTSIYASGESAGNPNIFIVLTLYNSNDNTVYGKQLNRNDIQQNLLTYETKTVTIVYDNKGTDETETYNYVFGVPVINKKTIDKLKYATLFIISNIVAETDSNNNIVYNTNAPLITTVWTINDNSTNGTSGFEVIMLYENKPLTLDDMFGLDGAIYRKFAEYGHISNVFEDLIALKLPKTIINGSEPKKSDNYFVIERNTYLDTINSETSDESAYNYNVVEMKINDSLNNPDFSYATSTRYDNDKKLLNIWGENGQTTKKIYYTGEIRVFSQGEETRAEYNAGTHESDGIEELSQSAEGGNSREESTVTTSIAGSFNIEEIGKYYDKYECTTNPLEEYLPVSYVPIIKKSNLLQQDNNIINRTNLYSFSNNSDIYYAYMGTSCTDANKGTLHIGTSDFAYMINLGKESLVSPNNDDSKNLFKQTEKLAIDINKTEINSLETKINNLNVKNCIKIDKINKYEFLTLELYHIYNDASNNKIVTEIKKTTSNTYVELYNNTQPCMFNSIKIQMSTNGKNTIINYLNTYYPELFENGYLDMDDSVTGYNIESTANGDFITVDIEGQWINDSALDPQFQPVYKFDNILIFNKPLIIHIIKTTDCTKIYI